MGDTLYATCGDLSIAYQVFGEGPVDLVFVGPFVSHIELTWTLPEFKSFFDQLSTFCRVVLFDKAGVGLSDPVPKVRTLDDRAAEIEAVMDAVGFTKAAVWGMSEGGPAACIFAATRPERTQALLLYSTFAYLWFNGWEDIDRDPAELRARALAELGERYTPSAEQLSYLQQMGRAIRSDWGTGAAFGVGVPSIRSMRQLATFERMCASPGMARASFETGFRMDVRPVLPTITAPTLVIHARGRPRDPGAVRPLPRRPHSRRADARGRWRGSRALVDRARPDPHRNGGIPHRWPCRAVEVTSRPAHRGVHRHGRIDATRRGDRR